RARDANTWERLAFCWFAVAGVLLGLMPVQFVKLLDPVTHSLVGAGVAGSNHGWLLFAPVSTARASYMPAVFMLFFIACCALAWVLVRRFYHGRLRRAAPWSCGFPFTTARMQDTAEGFGQPIREIFAPLLHVERQLPSPFDARPVYRVSVTDRTWSILYDRIAALTQRAAQWAGRLQTGKIAVYLTYSFAVLIVLLMLVRRW
ncbi:MAG: hydrogenase 4 subunit B, partial [Paraburkholderia sp.]|nr:hydrogenase 4 subunit B [Paraburkholderia sp.]